jgi:hypothetical protein
MTQQWHDLLFAHWPIPVATLRALVPPTLDLDTFDGAAWIGVVPFRMAGVRPRLAPAVPWLSAFPELNVRTYVKARPPAPPRPGVFFFSLEAANPLAVIIARRWFKLPYFHAQMQLADTGSQFAYRSRRTHRAAPAADFVGAYWPVGPSFTAQSGTLEHWFTERYSLYTADGRGRTLIGEIHHLPWPLQPAEADIQVNTMTAASGITLPDTPPLLHFAHHLNVLIWPLRRVEGGVQGVQ